MLTKAQILKCYQEGWELKFKRKSLPKFPWLKGDSIFSRIFLILDIIIFKPTTSPSSYLKFSVIFSKSLSLFTRFFTNTNLFSISAFRIITAPKKLSIHTFP